MYTTHSKAHCMCNITIFKCNYVVSFKSLLVGDGKNNCRQCGACLNCSHENLIIIIVVPHGCV